MNKDSKKYTLLYTIALVLVVSILLPFVAESLKDRQQTNEEVDKMKQILASVNVTVPANQVQEAYKQYITDAYVINNEGERVEGEAFAIRLKTELAGSATARKLPVYEATINGEKKYILEVVGVGLWGAIWGQVALNADKQTVYGTNFEHDSETPGLGAEIQNHEFASAFIGKSIFNAQHDLVSIAVLKTGANPKGRDYVDAISGGTITSQAVDAMLLKSLSAYQNFLLKTEL